MPKTELQEIREYLGASRRQFGEIFIHRSMNTIYMYETGRWKTPPEVLQKARKWKKIIDDVNEGRL